MNDVAPMADGNNLCSARHRDNALILDRSSDEVIWRWERDTH